jgi:deoxycytidylate deaminase
MPKIPAAFLVAGIEEAEKSAMRSRHGCVIVDSNGALIYKAYKKYEGIAEHQLNQNPNQHNKKGIHYSRHAEEIALNNTDRKKLNGAKLIVIRLAYDASNTFMNSKPCARCTIIIEKFIKKFGLKSVYYSE